MRGSAEAVDALLRVAAEHDVQALALVGDISGGGGDRSGEYRAVFRVRTSLAAMMPAHGISAATR